MSKNQGDHQHNWIKGRFYIMCATTLEEPEYYAPQGIVRIEYCEICGLLRLPILLRSPAKDDDEQEPSQD